jgi:hypothetical protein
MMTEDVAADLASLRAIAESGRIRPLLGGRSLVAFGSGMAIASALHALILWRLLPIHPLAIAVIWPVAMIGAAMIGRTGYARANGDVLVHRVERQSWQTAGRFLGLISVTLFAVVGWRISQGAGPEAWEIFTLMPPVTFGTYATAMAASAAVAGDTGLKRASWMALLFAAATTATMGSIAQFAVMALGAVLASVLPGMALLRRQRQSQ